MSVSMLEALPYFHHLDKDVLNALADEVRRHDLPAGARIIEEGQLAHAIYFLCQGSVTVTRRDTEQVLETLHAPTIFGEMAIIAEVPRLATVTAAEASVVLEVSRDAIVTLTGAYPALRERVLSFHRERLMRNVLMANPLFAPLDETERYELAKAFVSETVPSGVVLLEEGQPGRGLHVLLRGRCGVYSHTPEGELQLSELGEGDLFGEISLVLFDRMCTATVRTLSDCVVLRLDREPFQRYIMANATVRREVMQLALSRLHENDAKQRGGGRLVSA